MPYCILENGVPHHAELLQSILLLPLLWELLLLRGLGKTLLVAVKQQGFEYLCLNKLSPSFGVVFNIPVQISELLHGREHLQKDENVTQGKSQCSCAGHLYGSPNGVACEVNWACDVGSSGEPGCCFSSEDFSTFTIHLRRKSNSRGLISSFINKIWKAIWAVKISLSHSNKPLIICTEEI